MQRLVDEVTRAVQAQETVGIYFNWHNWGEYRSGFVLLAQGELLQLAVHDQGGRAALTNLNNIELRDVLTHPLAEAPRNKDSDAPQILELLSHLRPSAPTTHTSERIANPTLTLVPKPDGSSTETLVNETRGLLTQWLGAKVGQDMQHIAARYPPDQKPMQFLDECQKLLEPLVGKPEANRMFDPLRLMI
jgi:hypothetical protein